MKSTLVITLTIGLGVLACSDSLTGSGAHRDLQLTKIQESLLQAENAFGFHLFGEINKDSTAGNLFLSPLSVSMTLGMTLNGARGATFDSLRTVLGYGDISREDINAAYRDLLDQFTALDSKVTLQIANSIWTRQGFPVEQPFIDVNKQSFDATIQSLDFSDPGSVDLINSWVAARTGDHITHLLNSIPPEMVMYLMNAIYFQGDWTYQFDPEKTQPGTFYLAGGGELQWDMMSLKREFPYFETDQFQAIDLPYGNGNFSMVVLLPKQGYSPEDLIGELSPDQWNLRMNQFEDREGDLILPKFKTGFKSSLNAVLKAMGMEIAFEPGQADFSGISQSVYDQGQGLYISQVLHEAVVQVDEQGTEAAAATSVGVGVTSIPAGYFMMRVDRQFLFAIRERSSDTILFMGKLDKPEWTE